MELVGDLDGIGSALRARLERGQIFTAAGAIIVFPTASDDFFGSERFSLGPAAAAGYLGEKWVFGLTLQHWKDVAGDNDVPSVHMTPTTSGSAG